MRTAATAEAIDMDTRWDGLLVNARLVTLAGDAGYGVIEEGALGWHDGTESEQPNVSSARTA